MDQIMVNGGEIPFHLEITKQGSIPRGIKDPRFKQPTPVMQLLALTGSFEGHLSNLEDGIITEIQFANYMADHIKMLVNLTPFVEQGHW
jgi:hypothetical protein